MAWTQALGSRTHTHCIPPYVSPQIHGVVRRWASSKAVDAATFDDDVVFHHGADDIEHLDADGDIKDDTQHQDTEGGEGDSTATGTALVSAQSRFKRETRKAQAVAAFTPDGESLCRRLKSRTRRRRAADDIGPAEPVGRARGDTRCQRASEACGPPV